MQYPGPPGADVNEHLQSVNSTSINSLPDCKEALKDKPELFDAKFETLICVATNNVGACFGDGGRSCFMRWSHLISRASNDLLFEILVYSIARFHSIS